MPAYRYTGAYPAVYPSLVDSDGRTVAVQPGDTVTLPDPVTVDGLAAKTVKAANTAKTTADGAKPTAAQED